MRRTITVVAFLALMLTSRTAAAQDKVEARGDSIVLLVTSPRGQEVTFSGTLVLRNLKTTRRFDNVKTPFELRLPLHDFDADFRADDGGALGGQMLVFRDGKRGGTVTGTVYHGTVRLHHEPGVSFGFGGRNIWKQLTP